jgi:drug/metabolite transporter (DMT)-like permease
MSGVRWRSVGGLLIAVILWGLAPVANRYLVTRYDPIAILTLRFVIAAIAFIPLLRGIKAWPGHRRIWILLIVSGVVGIFGYNLPVTIGQQTTTAGMAGLIIASEPIWILLIWCLGQRRWPGLHAVTGAVIGFGGIILILNAQHGDSLSATTGLMGPLLILIAAIAWSAYCVIVRDVSATYGAVPGTALAVQIGTLPMLAIGAVPAVRLMTALSAIDWLVMLALTLGSSVIAVLLWNRALAVIGATRAGPFLYLIPLVSITGGVVVLGERPPVQVLIGGAIVLLGVVVASRQPKR